VPSADIKQARAGAVAQGPGPSLTAPSPDLLAELLLDPYGALTVEDLGSPSTDELHEAGLPRIRDVDAFLVDALPAAGHT
jgi:hypothetical protein